MKYLFVIVFSFLMSIAFAVDDYPKIRTVKTSFGDHVFVCVNIEYKTHSSMACDFNNSLNVKKDGNKKAYIDL